MRNVSRLLFAGTLLASLMLGTFIVPVGAQDISEAAHACQQGGHLRYVDADGHLFENAGACTSYVAQGGQLVRWSIDLSFVPHDRPDWDEEGCVLVVQVTGFPQGTHALFITTQSTGWTYSPPITVDSAGNGTFRSFSWEAWRGGTLWTEGHIVSATLLGRSSEPVVADC